MQPGADDLLTTALSPPGCPEGYTHQPIPSPYTHTAAPHLGGMTVTAAAVWVLTPFIKHLAGAEAGANQAGPQEVTTTGARAAGHWNQQQHL